MTSSAVKVVLLSALLSGCATCREHPAGCAMAVGTVVLAGAVVASSSHQASQPNQPLRAWYTK